MPDKVKKSDDINSQGSKIESIDDIQLPDEKQFYEPNEEYLKKIYNKSNDIYFSEHDKHFNNYKAFEEYVIDNTEEFKNTISGYFKKNGREDIAKEVSNSIEEKGLINKKTVDDVVKERKEKLEKKKEDVGWLKRAAQATAEQAEAIPGIADISFKDREEIKEKKREYDAAVSIKNNIRRRKEQAFIVNNYDIEDMSNSEISNVVKKEGLSSDVTRDLITLKENEGYLKGFYDTKEETQEGRFVPDKYMKDIIKGDAITEFRESELIDDTDKEQIIDGIQGISNSDSSFTQKMQAIEHLKENYISNRDISDKEKKEISKNFDIIASQMLALDKSGNYSDFGWQAKISNNIKELDPVIQRLDSAYNENYKDYVAKSTGKTNTSTGKGGLMISANPTGHDFEINTKHGMILGQSLRYSKETKRIYERLNKIHHAKTGFGKGVKSTDWLDIASIGIKKMNDMANQLDIANKIRKGSPLTEAEQRYINAVGDFTGYWSTLEQTAGLVIGRALPETLKFIGQFALTSGIGRGVYGGAKKAMQKALGDKLKKGFINRATRFAITKAGPALATGIPVQTALQVPMWATPTMEGLRGAVVPKKGYSTDYTIQQGSEKTFGEALKKGYGDAYQETMTEWAGFALAKVPRFAKVFKRGYGNALKKTLNKTKLPGIKVHGIDKIKNTFSKSYKTIHKTTGIGNIAEEHSEEVLGLALDAMEGEYKPENFKEFLKDQLVIAGTLAPISAPGTVASILSTEKDGMAQISFKTPDGKEEKGWVDTDILNKISSAVTDKGYLDKEKANEIVEQYSDKISNEKLSGNKKKHADNSKALILKYINYQANEKTKEVRQKTKDELNKLSDEELDNSIKEKLDAQKELEKQISERGKEGQDTDDLEKKYIDSQTEINVMSNEANKRISEKEKEKPSSLTEQLQDIDMRIQEIVNSPEYDSEYVRKLRDERTDIIRQLKENTEEVSQEHIEKDDPVSDITEESIGEKFVLERKYGNKKEDTLTVPVEVTKVEDGNVTVKMNGNEITIGKNDKVYTFSGKETESIYFDEKGLTASKQRAMPSIKQFEHLKERLQNNEPVNKEGWRLTYDEETKQRAMGSTPEKGKEPRAFHVKNKKGHTYRIYPRDRKKISEIETLKNKFENPKQEGDISFRVVPQEEWNPGGKIKDNKGKPYGDRIDMYIGDEMVGHVAERMAQSPESTETKQETEPKDMLAEEKKEPKKRGRPKKKQQSGFKVKEGVEQGKPVEEQKETEPKETEEKETEPKETEEKQQSGFKVKEGVEQGKPVEEKTPYSEVDEHLNDAIDNLGDAFTNQAVPNQEKSKTFEQNIYNAIMALAKNMAGKAEIKASEVLDSFTDYIQQKGKQILDANVREYIRRNYEKLVKDIKAIIDKMKIYNSSEDGLSSFDSSKRTVKTLGKYADLMNDVAADAKVTREEVDQLVIDFTKSVEFPLTSAGLPVYIEKLSKTGAIGKAFANRLKENEWTYDQLVSFHREWRDTHIREFMATYYENGKLIERKLNKGKTVFDLTKGINNRMQNISEEDITKAFNALKEQEKKGTPPDKMFEYSIRFLSHITGISIEDWEGYMSSKTKETTIYLRKTKDGKTVFEEVTFDNYKNMLSFDPKKLNKGKKKESGIISSEEKEGEYVDDKIYYKTKDGYAQKKMPKIINAIFAGYFSKQGISSTNQSRKQYVLDFMMKGKGQTRSNIEQLASTKEETSTIRFFDEQGNSMQSLLFTSSANESFEKLRRGDYKSKEYGDNEWVEHFKENNNFPQMQVYLNFVSDTGKSGKKAVDDEKMFENDFIGNMFFNFLNGSTEYDHWLGQFGDKANILRIKSPKYKLPENKEERKKITDNIPGFDESVKLVEKATKDRHYQSALGEEVSKENIEDYVYSWHKNDKDISEIIMGKKHQDIFNNDFVKATKRKVSLVSTGTKYLTGIEGGLEDTYNVAVIEDPVFGGDKESFDGVEFCTDEHMQKCAVSSGAITNKMNVEGIYTSSKEVSLGKDKNGKYYLYKTNKVNISILARHDPERYGALHQWMIANDIDRVVPLSGAKTESSDNALKLFNEDGTIKSYEELSKKEINNHIKNNVKKTEDLFIQQDLRHSTIQRQKQTPIQIFTNVLGYHNAQRLTELANEIRTTSLERFHKEFQGYSEKGKIAKLLEEGYFDDDPEIKEYLQREDATLNNPEYRERIRNQMFSHFQKNVLEIRLNRSVLQELPSDERLRTLSKTQTVDGKQVSFTDVNGNEKCRLPEVDASIPNARQAEYYDTEIEAHDIIKNNKETYADLIDENGNVKTWEISKEENGYKVPGEPVIVPRVPAHNVSSHLVARLNRNIASGNFIILDKEQQKISGSDYDGDTRFPMTKLKIITSKDAELANEWFDEMVKACEEPVNFEKNRAPIRIDRFDKKIDKRAEEQVLEFNDFASAMEMRNRNIQGQKLRGIMTNINSAFSFLSSVGAISEFRGTNNKKRKIISDKEGKIKALLGDLQNMAFDNNEKTRLPYLGINETTANMFSLLLMTHEKFDSVNNIEAEIERYMDELYEYFSSPMMKEFINMMKRKNSPVTSSENKIIFAQLSNKYGNEKVKTLKTLYYNSAKLANLATLLNGVQKTNITLEDIIKLSDTFNKIKDNPKDFGFTIKKEKTSLLEPLNDIVPTLKDIHSGNYILGSDIGKNVDINFKNEAQEKNFNRVALLYSISRNRDKKLGWEETEKKLIERVKKAKKNLKDNSFADAIAIRETKKGNEYISILDVYMHSDVSYENLKKIKEDFKKFNDSFKREMIYYAIQKYGANTLNRNGNFFSLFDDEFRYRIASEYSSFLNEKHDMNTISEVEEAYNNSYANVEIDENGNMRLSYKDIKQRPISFDKKKETTTAEQKPQKEEEKIEKDKLSKKRKYKGIFKDEGKGTSKGDGKDKAMRKVANSFLGEIADKRASSTLTSSKEIAEKHGINPNISLKGFYDEKDIGSHDVVVAPKKLEEANKIVTMLARNEKLKNRPLSEDIKTKIILLHRKWNAEFVVGDIPGVDSQFIDLLDKIGASYTIYYNKETEQQTKDQKETGNYVKYKKDGKVYIITKATGNNTVQIYNPNIEGVNSKKNVRFDNLSPTGDKAKIVNHKGTDYIVTSKNTIISMKTNKKMNWDKDNGNRKQILKLAEQTKGTTTTEQEEKETTKGNKNIDNQIAGDAVAQEYRSGNEELQSFIESHLQKKYPGIRIFRNRQAFFDFVENNGGEYDSVNMVAIGMAFKNAIFIDPNNAVQDTFMHENAHIYYNAIPAGDPIKIKLRKLFRKEGMSKEEVDEEIIKNVGLAGTNMADIKLSGTALQKFMDLLKEFWSRVKTLLGVHSQYDLVNVLAHDIWRNKKGFTQKDFTEYRINNMIDNPESRFTTVDGEKGHLYILDKGTDNEKIFTGVTSGISKMTNSMFLPERMARMKVDAMARQEEKNLSKYLKGEKIDDSARQRLEDTISNIDEIKKVGNEYLYKRNVKIGGKIIHEKDSPVDILSQNPQAMAKMQEEYINTWDRQQEVGTALHDIPDMLNRGISKKDISGKLSGHFSDETVLNQTIDYFKDLLDGYKEKGWTVETEKLVYDEENKVASRVDIYLTKGKEAIVIDLKTMLDKSVGEGMNEGVMAINDYNKSYESAYGNFKAPVSEIPNSKKNRHKYQVEIYANMAEKNYGHKVVSTRIVPIIYSMDENNKVNTPPVKEVAGKKYVRNNATRNKAKKMIQFFNIDNNKAIEKLIIPAKDMKKISKKRNISIEELKAQNKALMTLKQMLSDITNISVDEVSEVFDSYTRTEKIIEILKDKGFEHDDIRNMSMRDILKEIQPNMFNETETLRDFEQAMNSDNGYVLESDYKGETAEEKYGYFKNYEDIALSIWEDIGDLNSYSSLSMAKLGSLLKKIANLDNYHQKQLMSFISERYTMLKFTAMANEENKPDYPYFKTMLTLMGESLSNPEGFNGAMKEFKRGWGLLNSIGLGKLKNGTAANLQRVAHDIGSDNRMLQIFAMQEIESQKQEARNKTLVVKELQDIWNGYGLTNEKIEKAIKRSKYGTEYFNLDKMNNVDHGVKEYLEKIYQYKMRYDYDFAEREHEKRSKFGKQHERMLPVMRSFVSKEEFMDKFNFLIGDNKLRNKLYDVLKPSSNDRIVIGNKSLQAHKKELAEEIDLVQEQFNTNKINSKEAIEVAKRLHEEYNKNVGVYARKMDSKSLTDQTKAGIKMAVAGNVSTAAIRSKEHQFLFVNHLASLIHNKATQRMGLVGNFIINRTEKDKKGVNDYVMKKIDEKVYRTIESGKGGIAKDVFTAITTFAAKNYMGLNFASQIFTNIPAGMISNMTVNPEAMIYAARHSISILSNKNSFKLAFSAINRFRSMNRIGEVIDDTHVKRLKENTISKSNLKIKDTHKRIGSILGDYLFDEKGNKTLFYPLQMAESIIQTPLVMGMMTDTQLNNLIERERLFDEGKINQILYTEKQTTSEGKVLDPIFTKEDIIRITSTATLAHGLYGSNKPLWGASALGRGLTMMVGGWAQSYAKRIFQAPGSNILNQEISGYYQSMQTLLQKVSFNRLGADYRKKTRQKMFDEYINRHDKNYHHETYEGALSSVKKKNPYITDEEAKRYIYKEKQGNSTVYKVANFQTYQQMYEYNKKISLSTKQYIDNVRELFTDSNGLPMINEEGALMEDVKNGIKATDETMAEKMGISYNDKKGTMGLLTTLFYTCALVMWAQWQGDKQDDLKKKYGRTGIPLYQMSKKDQLKYFWYGLSSFRLGTLGSELANSLVFGTVFTTIFDAEGGAFLGALKLPMKLISSVFDRYYDSTASFDKPVNSSKIFASAMKTIPGVSANIDEVMSLVNILYSPDEDYGMNRYTMAHVENNIANFMVSQLSDYEISKGYDQDPPKEYERLRNARQKIEYMYESNDFDFEERVKQLALYEKSKIFMKRVEKEVIGTDKTNDESKKYIFKYIEDKVKDEDTQKTLKKSIEKMFKDDSFKEDLKKYKEFMQRKQDNEELLDKEKSSVANFIGRELR